MMVWDLSKINHLLIQRNAFDIGPAAGILRNDPPLSSIIVDPELYAGCQQEPRS
jgi:hypothetical protein